MMTRKDYVKVAGLLAGELAMAESLSDDVSRIQARIWIRSITFGLADIMAQDNDRFDRERFYQEVGIR